MKKITFLAVLLFAGSAAFAQTANPAKSKTAAQTVQTEGSKQKANEIKKSTGTNPIGKNQTSSGATTTNGKNGSTASKPAPVKSTQVKATIKNADKGANTEK